MKHLISTLLFVALVGGVTYPFKDAQTAPDEPKPLHDDPCSINGCMCWRTDNLYTVKY